MTAPVVVVIPARYGSTRLPAKPLRPLGGVAMIVRTARQALQSGYPVWVAHDDERIAAALRGEAVQAVMTARDHPNGTARLSEMVQKLAWSDETIVVNVQGDEPLLPPELICTVAQTLRDCPAAAVATLATPFTATEDPQDPNAVKVVCNQQHFALYFSRAAIPAVRDGHAPPATWLRHIGVYAYRARSLRLYPQWPATPLEQLEKLEQLRFLEHGQNIAVTVIANAPPAGVDCEADVARVEAFLQQQSS